MRRIVKTGFFLYFLAVCSVAFGQLTFSLTDLGSLPGNVGSAAYGVNSAGQVVGSATVGPTQHAFLYSNGVMSDLGLFRPFQQSLATSINANGQIAGYDWTSNLLDYEGFFSTGTSTQPLGWSGTCTFNQGCYSYGQAIDSRGNIVGCTETASPGYPWHRLPFFWDGSSMQVLVTLGGADHCALGTNGTQIVGYSTVAGSFANHAVVWAAKFPTDLPALSPNGSVAYAINTNQTIVGYSTTANWAQHAVQWSNGQVTDLGTLGGESVAYAVSSDGWIVGTSSDSQGNDYGFLNAHRCGMNNLNALLDSSGTGWTLFSGRGINDKHWIVGAGFAPDGFLHAYLLKPKGKQLCL